MAAGKSWGAWAREVLDGKTRIEYVPIHGRATVEQLVERTRASIEGEAQRIVAGATLQERRAMMAGCRRDLVDYVRARVREIWAERQRQRRAQLKAEVQDWW